MVEADFQREYGIDLSDPAQIGPMSWRRFATLLRGLGPNSTVVTRAYARQHGMLGDRRTRVIDGGPEEATAVFKSLFGGGGG